MKVKRIYLALLAALAVASVAVATLVPVSSNKCPIDGGGMYFTGQTKTVSGKLLYLYKCPQGHEVWVVK